MHRLPVGASHDFFHWVANMNESMGQQGGKLLQEDGPFQIIHAHDWLVADAAVALKDLFKVPLIATIHATEYGRMSGLHNQIHRYINSKEAFLAAEAWRVIVCTDYMRLEVGWALSCPSHKIDVIYNGICQEKKRPRREFDLWKFRRRFAADQEKIVYYVGRLTYEKGIDLLLSAAPKRDLGDGRTGEVCDYWRRQCGCAEAASLGSGHLAQVLLYRLYVGRGAEPVSPDCRLRGVSQPLRAVWDRGARKLCRPDSGGGLGCRVACRKWYRTARPAS